MHTNKKIPSQWLRLAFADLSRYYIPSVLQTVGDDWVLISAVDNGK